MIKQEKKIDRENFAWYYFESR